MSDFEMLCEDLHLPEQLNETKQLTSLKTWCEKQVSRDITFTGLPHEQYTQYRALAKSYLDGFIPLVPKDPTENVAEFDNMNAIQYAADNGYEFFLAKLPKTLPSVALDTKDDYGMSALHFAAVKGYTHTTDILLKRGANACIKNGEEQMPAYSALLVSVLDSSNAILLKNKEYIVRALVEKSLPSLIHQDSSGDTLFHLMAMAKFNTLLKDMLTISPSGAKIGNNKAHYPLHTAILNNKKENADVLFQYLTPKDIQLQRPLHYAVIDGSYDMVALCIQHTDNINERDALLQTPLILAAKHHNQNAVAALLNGDADKTLEDSDGFKYDNYIQSSAYKHV